MFIAPFVLGVEAFSSDYKVKKLNDVYVPDKVLKLDSKSYNTFTESPRNYTIAIALTTYAPEHGCKPCQ